MPWECSSIEIPPSVQLCGAIARKDKGIGYDVITLKEQQYCISDGERTQIIDEREALDIACKNSHLVIVRKVSAICSVNVSLLFQVIVPYHFIIIS